MADLQGFDANRVEPSKEFDPIPAGKYLAMITASEMKPNKAGTGQFLELTFQILEGEHKNRQLWARLNLSNPNETAMKIAQAELSALCRAVGVMTPRDSVELHNLPRSSRSSARSGRTRTRSTTRSRATEAGGRLRRPSRPPPPRRPGAP